MLYLILVFSVIYKLIIEERNYLLLKNKMFNAIILQLLRNKLLDSKDNPSTKLNQRVISDNNKTEVILLTDNREVIEKDTSNNQSDEKEDSIGGEKVVLTDSLVNDSMPSTIETIQYATLNDIIQLKLKGTVVNMVLSNGDNISGEVILNFKEVIALKSRNVTVWVNPKSVDTVL
ncbi:hypothetical protein [Clostridium sp. ZS2-4]|uniref:hypothetical protein n=1 Tax=Clostridium sp. ZS2-4 TaxID=2987703 RepID=UPI00227AB43D|nr:hypothetical protein [Clostridium sp. ZS2-4]MCY6355412.1 hypothetical protein [Clostridium sp. ZS2-4]